MDNDRGLVPADTASEGIKRSWMSPVVLDLGGMRQLTLLQGGSGGGDCTPPGPCP